MHFVGPAKCIVAGTSDSAPPEASSQQQELCELVSIQVLLTTVRKHANAFSGACKMHLCAQDYMLLPKQMPAGPEITRSSLLKPSGKMHFWQPAKCILAGSSDNAQGSRNRDVHYTQTKQCSRTSRKQENAFSWACKMHRSRHLGQCAAQSFLATAEVIAK